MVKLSESDLENYTDRWAETILSDLGNTFGSFSGFKEPDIIFSPDIKEECRGKLSREETSKYLNKIFGDKDPEEKKDLAEKLINSETFPKCLDDMEKNDGEFSPNLKKLGEKVRIILYSEGKRYLIHGEYSSEDNIITLYYNTFDGSDTDEYLCKLRICLAHEYLHAYHCFFAKDTFHEENYYSDIVREAIADFYSYKFGLDDSCAISDGINPEDSMAASECLYEEWEKNKYNDYPYAYARFFMYRDHMEQQYKSINEIINNGARKKLRYVFDASAEEMYRAFVDLVPEKERKFLEEMDNVNAGRLTLLSGMDVKNVVSVFINGKDDAPVMYLLNIPGHPEARIVETLELSSKGYRDFRIKHGIPELRTIGPNK